MNSMHHYLFRPGAPLVFGTGRPLDFGLGGDSLDFPYPSTLAGAVRAAAATAAGLPPDPYRHRETLPIGASSLVRLGNDLAFGTLLLARPADAVSIGGRLLALRPGATPPGSWSNLPNGLAPLVLSEQVDGKPDKVEPWWSSEEMSTWLESSCQTVAAEPRGDKGPGEIARTHVVMDVAGGKGAAQGGLFRTAGRDFGPRAGGGGYAIWVAAKANGMHGRPRRVGGEGRLVRIEQLQGDIMLPPMPKAAAGMGRVRFVLVTPAVFPDGGWLPDWMLSASRDNAGQARRDLGNTPSFVPARVPGTQVTVRMVAAAIARSPSYSGWQPAHAEGQAGPGRPWRVVPAGSVYWFDVVDGNASELHGRSLCQGEWLADGWGYGLVGAGGPTS